MAFYSFNPFYSTGTLLLLSFFHFNKVSRIPYGIFLHLSFSFFFLSFLGLSLTILRQFTCRNLIGALVVSKISFFKYHDIIMQMIIFIDYASSTYGVSAGKRDQIEIFFKKKFLSKIDVDLIIWSRTFIISKKNILSIWSLFPALTPIDLH